ncbi:MAG TPA: c-type cytochrome [Planctomycetota bacterium]|nr:c-type cytochrome [Planctomycetota bacterium]
MRLKITACSFACVAFVACHSPKSTADASFKAASFTEQVSHGQTLYGQHCAKCHGDAGEGTDDAPRVVDLKKGALPTDPPADRKARKGRFVTVANVADFVVKNMPPKKAGTLTTEQYLAILAFDLKANGIDLGQDKLTLEKAASLTIPR